MTVPCNCYSLLELSVNPVLHTHYEELAEFTAFLMSFSV